MADFYQSAKFKLWVIAPKITGTLSVIGSSFIIYDIFFVKDDDNDNILTFAELDNGDPDNDAFRDTDEDGIPDYLEEDDDNDGILTINEDVDQNGNPRDDDSNGNDIPNYLDKEDQITVVNNPSQPNTVETVFRTTVNVSGLEFDIEDENFESGSFSFGFKDTTVQIDNQ